MDGSKTEPYLFLGRCGYVKHDDERHPVPFRFRLVDYDGLKAGEKFRQFVKYARGEDDDEKEGEEEEEEKKKKKN